MDDRAASSKSLRYWDQGPHDRPTTIPTASPGHVVVPASRAMLTEFGSPKGLPLSCNCSKQNNGVTTAILRTNGRRPRDFLTLIRCSGPGSQSYIIIATKLSIDPGTLTDRFSESKGYQLETYNGEQAPRHPFSNCSRLCRCNVISTDLALSVNEINRGLMNKPRYQTCMLHYCAPINFSHRSYAR